VCVCVCVCVYKFIIHIHLQSILGAQRVSSKTHAKSVATCLVPRRSNFFNCYGSVFLNVHKFLNLEIPLCLFVSNYVCMHAFVWNIYVYTFMYAYTYMSYIYAYAYTCTYIQCVRVQAYVYTHKYRDKRSYLWYYYAGLDFSFFSFSLKSIYCMSEWRKACRFIRYESFFFVSLWFVFDGKKKSNMHTHTNKQFIWNCVT